MSPAPWFGSSGMKAMSSRMTSFSSGSSTCARRAAPGRILRLSNRRSCEPRCLCRRSYRAGLTNCGSQRGPSAAAHPLPVAADNLIGLRSLREGEIHRARGGQDGRRRGEKLATANLRAEAWESVTGPFPAQAFPRARTVSGACSSEERLATMASADLRAAAGDAVGRGDFSVTTCTSGRTLRIRTFTTTRGRLHSSSCRTAIQLSHPSGAAGPGL